jgi:hypothetical protein
MLSVEGLKYCPVSDVTPGNLIYLLRNSDPMLALRVAHPGGTAGTPYAAAVVLRDISQGHRMPITDPACGTQECVDLGTRAIVRWKPTLAIVSRDKPVSPDPGYLVLIRNQLALTSYYAGGRGERLHWDIQTGAHVEVGQSDFCFITEWQLGAKGTEGSFVELAAYPGDYRELQ